jgi:glycosyltransferase involved in cell wall biosynthesis
MSLRTLIVVSYWFAPSPAVGAKRFSFLVREFERQGYDVHVITHESREWTDWKTDDSLPLAAKVHRCAEAIKLPLPGRSLAVRAANSLLRRLLAPIGWELLWARAATRRALEIARSLPPGSRGVIVATTPAHAAMIAGARISRRLGWPLVVDYRDPWSAHAWPRWRRSALAQWFARRIERRQLARSAARVLNTQAMRASFEKFFPDLPRSLNFVIPNGFEAQAQAPPPAHDGPLCVVHAGEIFTGRSLVPVLRAVARLARRHAQRPIRVVTYGELPPVELARIRAEQLEPWLEVRPRIPFTELFRELQRAHLLLAVVGDHMLYSTPYKVYDYMAAARPILGIAPRGAALFELLSESGAGECVEANDEAGIERAIGKFLLDSEAPARARVERFRWSNLAQQYAGVIESVAERTAAPRRGRAATLPTSDVLDT